MLPRLALIREFTSRYRSRITAGLAVYGEFDPVKDKRVLSVEAQEEILDVGSYLEMLEEKFPSLGPQIRPVMAKAIVLYGLLRQLEKSELTREKARVS